MPFVTFAQTLNRRFGYDATRKNNDNGIQSGPAVKRMKRYGYYLFYIQYFFLPFSIETCYLKTTLPTDKLCVKSCVVKRPLCTSQSTSLIDWLIDWLKVNPDPLPHPGICETLLGLYHHIGSSLSPYYVEDSRILSLLSWGMWGISRRFVLIQDGGDLYSPKDFWLHFGTLEWTQVFTGICGIRVIVI